MDWQIGLLYGVCIIALLLVAGLLVWGGFQMYSHCYDTDKDLEEELEDGDVKRRVSDRGKSKRLRTTLVPERGGKLMKKSVRVGEQLVAAGRQTMLSTLHQSVTDNDVVLATALSAIPLRELGGSQSNIVVDVGQQMYLNRGELEREEHQCIVCSSRKEVTWNKVSCFAQTTISVLVYERTLLEENPPGIAFSHPQVSGIIGSQGANYKITNLSANHQSLIADEPSVSSSNIPLAPSPDSRLDLNPVSSPQNSPIKSAKSLSLSSRERSDLTRSLSRSHLTQSPQTTTTTTTTTLGSGSQPIHRRL